MSSVHAKGDEVGGGSPGGMLLTLADPGGALCRQKEEEAEAAPKQPNILDVLDYSKIVWPNPPAVTRIKYLNYFCCDKFEAARGKEKEFVDGPHGRRRDPASRDRPTSHCLHCGRLTGWRKTPRETFTWQMARSGRSSFSIPKPKNCR